jgi:PAS domain S-box-containing protein
MTDDQITKEELSRKLEEMRDQRHEVSACETELRKAQDKYEKLINSAPDAMIFVNMDCKIVMANVQFEIMFGYSQNEITGRDLDILIPGRFHEKHRKYIEDFFLHPRLRQMGEGFELYGVNKNAEEFPVDISLSFLRVDSELIATAAIRDITKRKQMEELVEMNYHIQKVMNLMLSISLEPLPLYEQLDRILELILSVPHLTMQSKGAIYIVEEEKPDILVMKAHRGFTGKERVPCETIPFGQCICGQSAKLGELIHTDQIDDRHNMRMEGMPPHGHYCVPIVSEGRTLGLINILIKEGHRKMSGEAEFLTAVAATLAGIIERTITEKEKRRLRDQLFQAEKLTALGRLTANVAHQIRNPLTSIGGFARRLERKVPEGTKEKDYINFMISEVNRLENILKDVLIFSRETLPHRENTEIHEILDRVLQLSEDICRERSISINRSYGSVPQIFIDKAHVLEAFENLISNAVDSMPEGGTLTIATGEEIQEDMPYVCVKITDTGTGIQEDKLDVIFEPFYSTKLFEQGTGLGLSITKKIVESHEGFIKVQSAVGKGSTFTICFPARSKPNPDHS